MCAYGASFEVYRADPALHSISKTLKFNYNTNVQVKSALLGHINAMASKYRRTEALETFSRSVFVCWRSCNSSCPIIRALSGPLIHSIHWSSICSIERDPATWVSSDLTDFVVRHLKDQNSRINWVLSSWSNCYMSLLSDWSDFDSYLSAVRVALGIGFRSPKVNSKTMKARW